jgi:hypothetical protein
VSEASDDHHRQVWDLHAQGLDDALACQVSTQA